MTTLANVMRYEMFFLLTALALIIGYRLLTQQINITGLLADKSPDPAQREDLGSDGSAGVISPSRIQMLVATLLITIYILTKVARDHAFPTVPQKYILALSGSHVIYLGGKVYSMFTERLAGAAAKLLERSKL